MLELYLNPEDTSKTKSLFLGLQNTNYSAAFLVAVFYWAILAYKAYIKGMSTFDHVYNILFHIVVPVIAIMPLFFEKQRFRHKDLFIIVPITLCYVVVLVVYALVTGKGVYDPIFTFNDVMSFVYLAVALTVLLVGFYLAWFVSSKVQHRYTAKAAHSQPQDDHESRNLQVGRVVTPLEAGSIGIQANQ